MKKISLVLLLSVFSFAGFAQTAWKSDKAHSQLKFDITHNGVSTVSGAFTDFDATIKASKPDFSDASFELTAKTGSINTGVDRRNEHLKSPDFFDATANPELTFKSTGVKKTGTDKYQLTGDLTMHGVTKPVTLELWYRGTITNPMNKKAVAGFRATGSIKRADFGIGPKFAPPMLSEEVTITADGEFGQ
ncbi:YceI family protein [Dyadobacter frigoris]|uniref:YceI family protein n=1 Tax=Dyadobacter frigoris TaxID=2576211 RepID=A0A4U6CV35_9BACT|nr:YceI family protein [Dyadobacter frigoris]TKT86938.1 YceI family protein [Dyadobacter frigoris]GLU56557.1 polyisoprenoid-binding protein [Dyadobacter frigoris]